MAIFCQKFSEAVKLWTYPQLSLSYWLANLPPLPIKTLLKLSSGLRADYNVPLFLGRNQLHGKEGYKRPEIPTK